MHPRIMTRESVFIKPFPTPMSSYICLSSSHAFEICGGLHRCGKSCLGCRLLRNNPGSTRQVKHVLYCNILQLSIPDLCSFMTSIKDWPHQVKPENPFAKTAATTAQVSASRSAINCLQSIHVALASSGEHRSLAVNGWLRKVTV